MAGVVGDLHANLSQLERAGPSGRGIRLLVLQVSTRSLACSVLSCKLWEGTVSTTGAPLHNAGIWASEAHQFDEIGAHERVLICHCFRLSLEAPKDHFWAGGILWICL